MAQTRLATLELKVASGPKAGTSIVLSSGEMVFGRAKTADVVLDWDRSTSSKHFKIEKNGERFVLQDLGSTNGTYVNGQPVTSIQLNNGDKLLAGSTIFAVHFVGLPQFLGAPEKPDAPDGIPVLSRVEPAAEKQRRTVSPEVFLRQVRVRLASGIKAGTVFWLGPGQTLVFGRTEKADCCLDFDANLSSRHFSVTCNLGHCEIEDLESRSGTRLNGVSITKARLFEGDQVFAGSTQFTIEVEGIGGPVVRTTADKLPAVPATVASSQKLEAIRSQRPSGVLRIRGKLADPDIAIRIFQILQQQPTLYMLLDFSRISLSLPSEVDVDSCKLFEWLPAVAAKKTPLLLCIDELSEWQAYIEDAWGSDALVGIQSQLPKEELRSRLVECLTDSSRGPVGARGILGFCWPSVLESLLENSQQEFAKKFFDGLNLTITEVAGDSESWQCFSTAMPEQFLKELKVNIRESGDSPQALQTDAPK